LVNTGQHYDPNMFGDFFPQLGLRPPDVNLEVGSGTHAWQTAEIMRRLEETLVSRKPDWVVVYGDVNSTVAAALACSKLLIPVAHVEAGLRSFDRTMPEEVNRLVTDQLADLLFTPSADANENLQREGIPPRKIHLVGNVMIDSLVRLLPVAEKYRPEGIPERYALVTLHRPANVYVDSSLKSLVDSLLEISRRLPVVFPVHPRTRQRLQKFAIDASKLLLLDPLPYWQFLALQRRAALVITDSGGIQEETTYLGVSCLTMRDNTERPITVTIGTNVLVGQDSAKLFAEVDRISSGQAKRGKIPPLWDGHASERIVEVMTTLASS
jgi:UDP-N-acetylglucosamine 2-epimerase (non-hydrolysing)